MEPESSTAGVLIRRGRDPKDGQGEKVTASQGETTLAKSNLPHLDLGLLGPVTIGK